MRNQVMWDLRDSRGLDIYEQMFLMIVESRGTSTSARNTAWDDMGMGHKKYYNVRAALIERGLLNAVERQGETTRYTVNAEAVAALVPSKGVLPESTGGVLPESTGECSDGARGRTPREDIKKNIKKTDKKNVEEEQETENKEDKEDSVVVPPIPPKAGSSSPIVPDPLIEEDVAAPAAWEPMEIMILKEIDHSDRLFGHTPAHQAMTPAQKRHQARQTLIRKHEEKERAARRQERMIEAQKAAQPVEEPLDWDTPVVSWRDRQTV